MPWHAPCGGKKTIVTLNRRAFDVLLYLVQNPGKVLTRDELLKNVWPEPLWTRTAWRKASPRCGGHWMRSRATTAISSLCRGGGISLFLRCRSLSQESLAVSSRMQLRSRPGEQPPAGYFFSNRRSGPVVITEEKQPLSLPAPRNRACASTLVAVLAIAGDRGGRNLRVEAVSPNPAADESSGHSSTGSPTAPRRSIAVLGFRNLSGRPEEAWLSTALAEMLSTELEAGEKLRLVSGEDIARTKLDLPLADADSLSRDTLARLHKDLDSDLIVLGSYTALGEKPGTRIRLDLRLQDTVAGETIADVAVVGSEADLFDMVSQAGSRLREKLGVEAVSPVEAVSIRASSPSNRDAARLYSEGLARLRVFDALEARDLLQQAIAADPKYSLAHSALAEAWSRLGYDKKAQQEAQQAYDLSANLSREDRLVVEGRYREIDHQYEKAIEVYRTLFTLFPDNVDYGLKLAWSQCRGGKGHDALATVESLRKLAPPASEDPRIDLAEADAWWVLGDSKRQQEPLARAIGKARAQGARLILARALEGQSTLFDVLGQTQNAIDACRESTRHFRRRRRPARRGQGFALFGGFVLRPWGPASVHRVCISRHSPSSKRTAPKLVWPASSTTSPWSMNKRAITPAPRNCIAKPKLAFSSSMTKRAKASLLGMLPRNEWSRGIYLRRFSYMRRRCS